MPLHPLIIAVIDAIREDGVVSWRSDLSCCQALQKAKPNQRPDVFVSAMLALGRPSEHDLPDTDALVSILGTLMTVKSARSWTRLTLQQEHVADLLHALHGDPFLPRWLLERLRNHLVATRDAGVSLHPFFEPYTNEIVVSLGTEKVRALRERFPHPDGPLPPGPKDALQQLAEEIEGLRRAQDAQPTPRQPEGWNANKAHADALRDWFRTGPATRTTNKGALGITPWGWWRVRPFQLKLWGTTLKPDLDLWFSALDPETAWPPATPRSAGAPSVSSGRGHVSLPLFLLMAPKHGPDPIWSVRDAAPHLDPWWEGEVVPWMTHLAELTPLTSPQSLDVAIRVHVSKTALRAAIARRER